MKQLRRYALVLSIYLNTRGFSFIVFEGPLSPFDWGIREARGSLKGAQCLTRITNVIEQHLPDILVVQDTSEQGTRRAQWIGDLNQAVCRLGQQRNIPVFAYSRDQIRSAFEGYGCPNKQCLAELIAKYIPAFERYVPPPRKPWMSEDSRMGLFDAAALALVFFRKGFGQA